MKLPPNFSGNKEYLPSEDTFFVTDYIENLKGESALDVGSGSGYLTKILSKNFSLVVGTDINFGVLKDQTYKTKNLVCCNGSDGLKIQFDLVVCNLPYLDTEEILDISTDGGREGIEVPKKIIFSINKNIKKGGKFIFVTTSLSNHRKLVDYTQKFGFDCKLVAKKKLFFEELILFEATKIN